jgi:long-chain fatty acid transport protein
MFGNLGIPYHTQFATGQLHASNATGFGGNFGVWVQPIPQIEIGARYLTRVKLDYEGTATFEQVESGVILPPQNPLSIALGLDPTQPLPLDPLIASLGLFQPGAPLSEQTVTTSITMPDQFTIGVAWQVNPRWKVLADYQWVHWGLFQRIEADFEFAPDLSLEENYSNTSAIRLGVDWMTSEMVSLRGGYLYHQGAAPAETVTPLLPEGDRNEFTVGAGFRFGEHWMLDLAYQFINQDKRRGRVREPFPGDEPTVELNSGLYTFNAHLLAATIAVNF